MVQDASNTQIRVLYHLVQTTSDTTSSGAVTIKNGGVANQNL